MDNILTHSRSILITTPVRFSSLFETIAPQILTRSPAPGEWSAVECLMHIIATEKELFPVRVQAFLAGENFPAFDPKLEPVENITHPQAWSDEFARLRYANMGLFDSLKADDLNRPAIHPEIGPVTLGEMIHEWATHDLNHLIQAERAIMQPFIQGCGAWQVYFTDNIIKT